MNTLTWKISQSQKALTNLHYVLSNSHVLSFKGAPKSSAKIIFVFATDINETQTTFEAVIFWNKYPLWNIELKKLTIEN